MEQQETHTCVKIAKEKQTSIIPLPPLNKAEQQQPTRENAK
jgi:hypothetical protein